LIRITVARYHTPTGRVIQREYEKSKSEQYYEALYNRYQTGELYDANKIPHSDNLRYYTLKNKRTVYGGGGIIPDIFIPLDTSKNTPYHSKLVRLGIIHQFALQFADKHRKQFTAQYPTLIKFNSEYKFTEADFEELIAFAANHKLPRNDEDIAKSKSDISIQMKGLISQDLFGVGAYYEVVYPLVDTAYQQALKVMQNWKDYEHLLMPEVK